MKTDIWVECSAKITKKKCNYKSKNLPIFCISITWLGLARFGKIIRIILVETLTFRIRRFFHELFHIWQSRIFLLSLCQASMLNQPPSGGRKREKRGIGFQAGLDFQTTYFLKESNVHVYIARCLYRICKGFEGLTSKQPCRPELLRSRIPYNSNCVAKG